jgi:hypothetical protein
LPSSIPPFCPSFAARSLGKEEIDIFDMLSHNCTQDPQEMTTNGVSPQAPWILSLCAT